MKDFAQMLKQAQAMQAKMADLQSALDALAVEGQAGAGLVKVRVDGKGVLKGITIDPGLLKPEEADILADLIVAAYGDGRARAEAAAQEKMAELTQGLGLPSGFKPPF
ncbi:MAG: YbaB/EbfC family nucleoid-associated protein [Alphaproteobacteria bacterium]|nr:MAG: YbaB/EbfC family nucleoid-associated protein [Alphaproteobacteria bacterium]